MMARLERLLRPRKLLVMGGGWAASVVEQCQRIGFDGEIWVVNPNRESMHGVACVASLEQLPGVPDAAFVGINRDQAVAAVAELAQMGCGGVVCFASGFSEVVAEDESGPERQAQLVQAAGSMPLFGPNCYGLINYLDAIAIWPDQHGGRVVDTGVGVIAQSSNIAINITMQRRALPLAYVLTAGNQAQTGIAAMGQALLRDERVTALGLYLEGIDDVPAFEALARQAASAGKRVFAIKAGASEQSRQAVVSHTNSIAGSDAAASALLQRLGIVRVDSPELLLECLKIAHVHGSLHSRTVQSMSCSGGEAALMADTAASGGVVFPALEQPQQQRLRAALGPRVALANPLDYHTYIWADRVAMQAAFAGMLVGGAEVTLLVLDFPRNDYCDDASWQPAIDAFCAAVAASSAKAGVIASLPENLPEHHAAHFLQHGIVPLCGFGTGLNAIAALAQATALQKALLQHHELPLLPAPSLAGPTVVLPESVAKEYLAAAGIAIPASKRFDSCDAALAAVASWSAEHYPLVLKASGLAHKTEAGGVVTDITDAAALDNALRAMERKLTTSTAATRQPYLIETMISGVVFELLVSVVRHPGQGFLLTLASGGIHAELLCDSTHLLLPVTRNDISRALSTLSAYPILAGYRGQQGANIETIVDSVIVLQQFVNEYQSQLQQIEINPLLCCADSAVAVDALIEMRAGWDRRN